MNQNSRPISARSIPTHQWKSRGEDTIFQSISIPLWYAIAFALHICWMSLQGTYRCRITGHEILVQLNLHPRNTRSTSIKVVDETLSTLQNCKIREEVISYRFIWYKWYLFRLRKIVSTKFRNDRCLYRYLLAQSNEWIDSYGDL